MDALAAQLIEPSKEFEPEYVQVLELIRTRAEYGFRTATVKLDFPSETLCVLIERDFVARQEINNIFTISWFD